MQPYNSATPSAGFDRWELAARGLGVACIHMHALSVVLSDALLKYIFDIVGP